MSGRGLHLAIELADVPPIPVLAQLKTLAPQVVRGEVLAQECVALQLGEQDAAGCVGISDSFRSESRIAFM